MLSRIWPRGATNGGFCRTNENFCGTNEKERAANGPLLYSIICWCVRFYIPKKSKWVPLLNEASGVCLGRMLIAVTGWVLLVTAW